MKPFTHSVLRAVRFATAAAAAVTLLAGPRPAGAAVPGIQGTSFSLVATEGFTSQPDGASIYTWGYGCDPAVSPAFVPFPGNCPQAQLPGPTLVIPENTPVTVKLTNRLPLAAGNTSIVFPGLQVSTAGGVAGLLAQEAANGGGTVTYTITATSPGTYAYYSGTQADLQIEMGLFGAIVVLPAAVPAGCTAVNPTTGLDYRLAASAYDHPDSCYDREYMFQLSELDSRIHDQAYAQVKACVASPCPQIVARTEPYRPNYFLVNGRSMPDDMDTSYAPGYPAQPYNANPHMHPGERVLMRVVGQGRTQHPFHFHGNHARVLARDGRMLLSAVDQKSLAGPLLFTTPSVPGQAQDQIFTWTGKGLNWDVYNHKGSDGSRCIPDANGYHSIATDPNYREWCADHTKPIPVIPPDPTIVAIGQWYGGTPYLGVQSTGSFTSTNEPPGTLNQNPEAGYAYMWHSHNEREITTNDVFPGGMMVMLLIDPPTWVIKENL